MRNRVAIVALALVFAWPAAAAGPGHEEKPDNPPAPVNRAAQPRSPASPVVLGNFHAVQVNVDADGNNVVGDAANEPSMAIDPTNPLNIVIGWRQFDTVASNFRQAGVAYSHDGGLTWTFPGVIQPGQFRSDPVLSADSQGRFFYYSLSSTTSAEMFVSTDKGVTWTGPTSAFGGDKTWMTADTTGGTGNDNLYMLWNSQYSCCGAGTDYTRTTNSGVSFDGPFATPSKPKWGTLDVGPDGTLFEVGTRITGSSYPLPHLLLISSNAQDAGQTPTFDTVTGLRLGGETTTGGTPNPGGLMGQVWVAADRSSGPTRGNVYVLGSVDPSSSTDPIEVRLVRSTDGGATFGPAIRVSDRADGVWQWFGTLSVGPDGRLDVVWNDTRGDTSGHSSAVYYAYSTDAGSTWSHGLQVTPRYDSTIGWPNQNKMGDYYQMISEADDAALAFAATFRGEEDVYFLRVGDCNANGLHDSKDIASGTSADCNLDGIPDECESNVSCLTCNNDGVCERGESCASCPADCPAVAPGCGNGICETASGEDCLTCPADCNGIQSGAKNKRFCCGGGGGTNPVACSDPRCTETGYACSSSVLQPTCCGDGRCEGTETTSSCVADCVVGTPGEATDLRVSGRDKVTGRIDLSYTPACDAKQHTVYSGPLSAVSTYGYTAAACNLGSFGVASFTPGSGNLFFLVVGNDGTQEGAYGTGAGGTERPEATGVGACDLPRNSSGVICQ